MEDLRQSIRLAFSSAASHSFSVVSALISGPWYKARKA